MTKPPHIQTGRVGALIRAVVAFIVLTLVAACTACASSGSSFEDGGMDPVGPSAPFTTAMATAPRLATTFIDSRNTDATLVVHVVGRDVAAGNWTADLSRGPNNCRCAAPIKGRPETCIACCGERSRLRTP